jgi:polysaccharide pyruvyl transferase WcaK-like protein
MTDLKAMTSGRRRKIALMGPFGFGNLGDGAIQDAAIANIRRISDDCDVYGISQNPEDTQRRHGIPAFPINRKPRVGADWEEQPQQNIYSSLTRRLQRSRWGRIAERLLIRLPLEMGYVLRSIWNLRGFDLLVVSGGGQLDDYWGGAWAHPYTLAKWGTIARLLGVDFAFISVGAGPIDAPMSRRFIRYALGKASYRSYRDEHSRALIRSIGFDAADPVCPDLAYSVPTPPVSKEASRRGTRVLGIGPMSYYHPDIWPEKDRGVYESYLARLADTIVRGREKGWQVVLFPSEIGSDRVAMADLHDMLAARGITPSDPRVTQRDLRTVTELLEFLGSVDIVVASRFHGVLLAHVMNTPVVAISYHDKIDSLMNALGHEEYCCDIRTFTADQVIGAVTRLESCSPAARVRIAEKMSEYRGILDRQYHEVFDRP